MKHHGWNHAWSLPDEVRKPLVEVALWVACLCGTISFLINVSLVQTRIDPRTYPLLWIAGLLQVATFIAALWRTGPPWMRTTLAVANPAFLAWATMIVAALRPGVVLTLLGCVLLAGLIIGKRAFIIAAVLTVAGVAAAGLAWVSKVFPIPGATPWAGPTEAGYWIGFGNTFLLWGGGIVFLVGYLIANLESYYANQKELAQTLAREQQKRATDELRHVEERARLAEERADNERLLASLFRVAPVGIALVKNRIVERTNDYWLTLLGYKQEEMVGRSTELLYASREEFERVGHIVQRLPAGRSTQSTEAKLRTKDSAVVDILLHLVWFDPNDTAKGYLAIGVDVTEQRQTAEALARERRFFEVLFDALPGDAFVLNEDGRYLRWNRNLEQYIGLSNIMKGVHALAPVHPRDQERAVAALQKVFTTGGATLEYTSVRADGTETKRLASAQGLTWDGKRYAIGISLDISDLVNAETALRQSEARFRSVFENAFEGIFQLGLDGQILSANQSLARMFGFESADEMLRTVTNVGEQLFKSILDRNHLLEMISTAGKVVNFEVQLRRKDGSLFWALANAHTVMDSEGRVLFREGSCLDITERKQMESLLIAKAQADAAARAKTVFLASMSHEIRTPLNAVLGFAQILGKSQSLAQEERQYVDIIIRNGEHLLELINSILEMSKIEAGRLTLDPKPFDIKSLLAGIESAFLFQAEAKGLQLVISVAPRLPDQVTADPKRIRQILYNLVGNAVKFTDRGSVTLRASVARDSEERNWLNFEVEDTGPGISPEEQARLFKPFSQAAEGHRLNTGTGLGLVISRELARLMGGDVMMSSQVGIGSVFRVKIAVSDVGIPGADMAAPPLRQVLALAPGQAARRILIVDDVPDNCELLQQLLEPCGFETAVAVDGHGAIDRFQKWTPAAILMDLRMPGMDGNEAIRQIRTLPGGREVKILALTASAFEENRQITLEHGADDFLGKPFLAEELFEKLRSLLGVSYIYQEPVHLEKPSTKSTQPQLEPQLVAELIRLAEAGERAKLLRLIAEIGKAHSAFASDLRSLVENFHYDRLIDVLRTASAPP